MPNRNAETFRTPIGITMAQGEPLRQSALIHYNPPCFSANTRLQP
nr:hypothetical protein [uncultured Kingella sp.]